MDSMWYDMRTPEEQMPDVPPGMTQSEMLEFDPPDYDVIYHENGTETVVSPGDGWS